MYISTCLNAQKALNVFGTINLGLRPLAQISFSKLFYLTDNVANRTNPFGELKGHETELKKLQQERVQIRQDIDEASALSLDSKIQALMKQDAKITNKQSFVILDSLIERGLLAGKW